MFRFFLSLWVLFTVCATGIITMPKLPSFNFGFDKSQSLAAIRELSPSFELPSDVLANKATSISESFTLPKFSMPDVSLPTFDLGSLLDISKVLTNAGPVALVFLFAMMFALCAGCTVLTWFANVEKSEERRRRERLESAFNALKLDRDQLFEQLAREQKQYDHLYAQTQAICSDLQPVVDEIGRRAMKAAEIKFGRELGNLREQLAQYQQQGAAQAA